MTVRSSLLACVLTFSATLAGADPTLVSPAPVLPSSFPFSNPTVVATDDGFFTSWLVDDGIVRRVDSNAVDGDGRATWTTSRPVFFGANNVKLLNSTDGGSLITFEDLRNYRRFARLDRDGSVITDPSALPAFTNSPIAYASADGTRTLLLRHEPGRLEGVLLDEHAAVLRTAIPLPQDVVELGLVIPDSAGFLFVRGDATTAIVHRMNRDGEFEAPQIVPMSPPMSRGKAAGASDGDRRLVFWSSDPRSPTATTSGALLAAGSVLKRIQVPRRSSVTSVVAQELLFLGDHYVLVLQETGETGNKLIAAMRFDRDGNALDSQPVTISPGHYSFYDAAWKGSTIYVVAGREDRTVTGIAFRSSTSSISTARSEDLFIAPARQTSPATATSGSTSLVVWRERSAAGSPLRASLIINGTPSETITLSSDAGSDPSVAYGGGVYLVTWSTDETWGVRISANGLVLDPAPRRILAAPRYSARPAIAWDGARFLLVVSGGSQGAESVFVSPTGTVAEPRELTWMNSGATALAWNGSDFILAYPLATQFIMGGSRTDIYLLSLAPDGSLKGKPKLIAYSATRAVIAAHGSDLLVITESLGGITGVWVGPSGLVVTPSFTVALGSPDDRARAVAASWDESAGAFLVASYGPDGGVWRLRTGYLDTRSLQMRDSRFRESMPDRKGGSVAVIAPGNAVPLVVFSEIDHDVAGGTSRLLIESIDHLWPTKRRRSTAR